MKQENGIQLLARRNEGLFDRVCRSHRQFAAQIDSSHLPADFAKGDLLKAIAASPRGARKLSRKMLHLGEDEAFFIHDFTNPRRRLVLLEPAELLQLVRYAGAAICRSQITRIIAAPQVHALKLACGEDVYHFATRRASFFHKPPEALVPEDIHAARQAEAIVADLEKAGHASIETCLSGESSNLTRRIELKLPASWTWDWQRNVSPTLQTQAWEFLRDIVTRELSQEWKTCLS